MLLCFPSVWKSHWNERLISGFWLKLIRVAMDKKKMDWSSIYKMKGFWVKRGSISLDKDPYFFPFHECFLWDLLIIPALRKFKHNQEHRYFSFFMPQIKIFSLHLWRWCLPCSIHFYLTDWFLYLFSQLQESKIPFRRVHHWPCWIIKLLDNWKMCNL